MVVVVLVDYDETLQPPLSPPYRGWNEQQTESQTQQKIRTQNVTD